MPANAAYISTRYKQILGYEDDEIETEISFEEFANRLHPDDRDRLSEALANHFQHRVPYDVEYRIRKKSGDYCWIHSTGQATWDDAGNPLRMAGSIIDISDRKAAEAALAQANEQLEKRVSERTSQLTNLSQAQQRIYQIGLQSYDSLAACLDAYVKAGCDIFDLDCGIVAQVVDRTYTIRAIQSEEMDLEVGAELDYADTYCQPVIEQHQTICYCQVGLLLEESRPSNYDRARIEAYIAAPILVRDRLYGTVNFSSPTPREVTFDSYYRELIQLIALCIGREIEVWQAKSKLQASNRQYELVLKGAGAGIVDWDIPADRGTLSNRFKAILGYEPDEECLPTFERFLQAVHPDDRKGLQQAVTAHFERQVPYFAEYRVINKQGEYIWVQATGEAIRDKEGNPLRMVIGIVDISDRKQAEDALKTSEARYALVVQGSEAGIWDWNILTDENYMSSRFKQMLGYEEDELDNFLEEWENRVHPDDLERVWELHNSHLQHRTPYKAEYRMRTKTGDYIWILDTAQAIWDEEGNPVRMAGSVIDISDRKAAKEALQESEERYTLAVQSSGNGIFDWDILTDEVYLSPRLKQIMGYEDYFELPNEVAAWEVHIHPDDRNRVLTAVQNHLQQKIPYDVEYRLRTKAGNYCWVYAKGQATWDERGNPLRLVRSIIDISDRKAAEAALEASQERYSLAVQASGNGIFDWNILTNEIYLSPLFKQIMGYEDCELPSELAVWEDHIHPDDRDKASSAVHNHLQQRIPFDIESRLRTKTGNYCWVHAKGQAIWDDKGNPTRMAGSIVEISDLQRTAAELNAT